MHVIKGYKLSPRICDDASLVEGVTYACLVACSYPRLHSATTSFRDLTLQRQRSAFFELTLALAQCSLKLLLLQLELLLQQAYSARQHCAVSASMHTARTGWIATVVVPSWSFLCA